MTNTTMSADEFYELIRSGVSDFTSYGPMEVVGDCLPWIRDSARCINLGSLVFMGRFGCDDWEIDTLDCGSAVFHKPFWVGNLIAKGFLCEKATFHQKFFVDEAYIRHFCCGSATFNGDFELRWSTFGTTKRPAEGENPQVNRHGMHCFNARIATFNGAFRCGEAWFANWFRCGDADFNGDFDCELASFDQFYGSSARFKGTFKRETATFRANFFPQQSGLR